MSTRIAVAVRPAEDSDLAAILAVRDRHEGIAVHEQTTLERATWREIMATDGQIVGTATLLERMLADADAAGCNKVQLLAHKRHAFDGAHSLYEKVGFTPEAEGFRRYLRQSPAFASDTGVGTAETI